MSKRSGIDPNVFQLLSSLDTPVGTAYRDALRQMQEQRAREAEVQSAQDEDGRGFLNNQARGIGAAFTRVGGEIVEGLAALDSVSPRGVVPGVPHYAAPMVNEQRAFERGMSDEEFKTHKEAGYQNAAKIADEIKSVDFGYDKERNSVEKTKELFSKGNWLAGSMSVPGMLTDQLSQSIPYMLNAPVTAFAIGGNTARERVKNTEGKLAPDGEDVAISAVVGTASGVLERLLPKMIFRPGETMTQAEARSIANSATKYAMGKIGKEAARGATVEALTESIQTGVLEYVGQRYGTDKAMSLQEAAMQGLEGALIGGGIGGSLGAGRGAVDSWRNVRNAGPDTIDQDGIDLPQNGEQLRNLGGVEVGGGITDDTPDNMRSVGPVEVERPLLRDAGNPENPNDRFKFELDTDSFVSNLRRRIDARKAQEAAISIPSASPQAEDQETTLADVARKFGEENGFIQKPIAYEGGVNFERVPVPKPEPLTLAPLDQPQGGIDFVTQPARTEQLASGVEKAISANIDKARNSRMPENLKDVRLLRSRYREHLSDVAAGVESNAGAFEKADSLLEMAAKSGGLNADAWVSEGVDPADLKAKNGSAFAKAFRADGGMTPDDLAEFAAQNGFSGFTDESGAPVSGAAIEAVLGELAGNKRYSSEDELKLQSAQAAPDYIKELAEFGTPAEIKQAVTKALNGEKLGARQAVIVQEVLDSTNRFKRDDAAIGEKWEKRARTMLANKGNRELDQWRNRDEHEADATTEDAALNELMTDAMVQYGIDPDKVIAAHEQYAKRYPDSLGKLTYAMTAWVSANKPAISEPEQNGKRDSVPGYRSNRRDDEGVQVPVQRSAGEPGAVEAGLSVPRQRQAAEAGGAPGGIESRASAEPRSDSAGRDAGLRQPVDLPEGWDKSLIKARPIAKTLGVPGYKAMRLGELAEAIRAKRATKPAVSDEIKTPSDSGALPAEKPATTVSDEISASNQEPIKSESRAIAGFEQSDALRNQEAVKQPASKGESLKLKIFGRDVEQQVMNKAPIPDGAQVVSSRIITTSVKIPKNDRPFFKNLDEVFAWRFTTYTDEDGALRSVTEVMDRDTGSAAYFSEIDANAADSVRRLSPSLHREFAAIYAEGKELQAEKQPQPSAGVAVSEPQKSEPEKVEPAAPAMTEADVNAELLKSVPPKILKSLMVDYQVYNEDTGQYETEKVPARDALKSVNDDISTFESMLACVKGGK